MRVDFKVELIYPEYDEKKQGMIDQTVSYEHYYTSEILDFVAETLNLNEKEKQEILEEAIKDAVLSKHDLIPVYFYNRLNEIQIKWIEKNAKSSE